MPEKAYVYVFICPMCKREFRSFTECEIATLAELHFQLHVAQTVEAFEEVLQRDCG